MWARPCQGPMPQTRRNSRAFPIQAGPQHSKALFWSERECWQCVQASSGVLNKWPLCAKTSHCRFVSLEAHTLGGLLARRHRLLRVHKCAELPGCSVVGTTPSKGTQPMTIAFLHVCLSALSSFSHYPSQDKSRPLWTQYFPPKRPTAFQSPDARSGARNKNGQNKGYQISLSQKDSETTLKKLLLAKSGTILTLLEW